MNGQTRVQCSYADLKSILIKWGGAFNYVAQNDYYELFLADYETGRVFHAVVEGGTDDYDDFETNYKSAAIQRTSIDSGVVNVLSDRPCTIADDHQSLRTKPQPNKNASVETLFSIKFTSGSEDVDNANQPKIDVLDQTYVAEDKETRVDLTIAYDPELEVSGAVLDVTNAEWGDLIKVHIWHPYYGPEIIFGELIEGFQLNGQLHQEHPIDADWHCRRPGRH